jgi:putative photosynthetic complex assembly protein 2
VASAAGAIAFAVFIWWFSTGLVILLNRLSKKAPLSSRVASTAVAVVALAGIANTAGRTDLASAYCAFTCALLVWGWHELSFLSGWITGPRKTALDAGIRGWQRFVESVRAILWHEIAIICVGTLIIAITWNQPNQTGTGAFIVLWALRTSAKLNLFFGVRNLSEAFLPDHLAYLESFFRRRAMNAFFPIAIGAAFVAFCSLVVEAVDAGAPARVAGLTLVATLLALAIIEHLMLVLPLDTTALWRWALRQPVAHPVSHGNPSQTTPTPPLDSRATTEQGFLHAR